MFEQEDRGSVCPVYAQVPPGLPKDRQGISVYFGSLGRATAPGSRTCHKSLDAMAPDCARNEGHGVVGAPWPMCAGPLVMVRTRSPAQPLRQPQGRGFHLSSTCVLHALETFLQLRVSEWPGCPPALAHF